MQASLQISKKAAFLFLLTLLCGTTTARAQGNENIRLLYETQPGFQAVKVNRGFSATDEEVRSRRFDANGDGVNDTLDPTHRLTGVADLNEDGLANLVVRNLQTRTAQVWGHADN